MEEVEIKARRTYAQVTMKYDNPLLETNLSFIPSGPSVTVIGVSV